MRVDIISDVVCPWCAIGYYQLAAAGRETGTSLDIHWNPFQLNPGIGPEGENLAEHLAAKYGTTREDSLMARHRITQLGKDVGFTFNFTDDSRTWNTFDAHRLIGWAETHGRQHEAKLALLKANFTDNRNVSDHKVLADIATSVGLNGEETSSMLSSDAYNFELNAALDFWRSKGISGVPSMIFDGKHLVSGAQGVENYARILSHLSNVTQS